MLSVKLVSEKIQNVMKLIEDSVSKNIPKKFHSVQITEKKWGNVLKFLNSSPILKDHSLF